MQLDSVRELKHDLACSVLAPWVRNVEPRRVAFRGGPVARTSDRGSLALGLTRRHAGDFALAVRLQDRILESGPLVETILQQARGEVDMRYIGQVTKRSIPWHRQQTRPLLIGSSISHLEVNAGTLGCFAKDRDSGATLVLSNNHVLANENRGQPGDAILQPSSGDGGESSQHTVGTLERFVALESSGPNLVDAAVASLNDVEHDRRTLTDLGTLAGLGDPVLDEGTAVAKIGRTTGLTRGRVSAFEMDNVVVCFEMGFVRFDNQVEIEGVGGKPFSRGGDSGSLILDEEHRAVALLFAGTEEGGAGGGGLTYANPLGTVLDSLAVDLVF